MRTEEALERYLVQLQADGRSEHTVKQARRHVGLLVRWLAEGGRGEIAEVTHEDLAAFLASDVVRRRVDGRPRKATSANALRSSLRAFFGFAHAAGYTARNAARLVRMARCGPPLPRALSEEDLRRLQDTLILAQGPEARRDHLLVDLLASTGLRLGAALSLENGDVDLVRGEILVRRGKGDRPQRVFLGRGIWDHLVGYLAERGPGPLFTDRRGRPITARHAQRRMELWMRRAECRGRGSPHALRHAFAMGLYRRTGDLLVVQAALGHRSIAATMVYARADEGRVRAAMQVAAGGLASRALAAPR